MTTIGSRRYTILLITVWCVALSVVASGCLDIDMRTRVRPDGSGIQNIRVGIEKKYLALLDTAALKEQRGTLEEQLRKSLPAGSRLTRTETGGIVYYSTEIPFRDTDELRHLRSTRSPGATSGGKTRGKTARPFGITSSRISFRAAHGLAVSEYTFSESLAPGFNGKTPEEQQLLKAFTMSYALTMPGKIIRSNADEMTGSRAVWKLSPIKGGTVTATSRVIQWGTLWWIAAGVAGALLLVALALLALLRRLR